MNKQKSQTNPFKQKSDQFKKKYGIDNNNNNSKSVLKNGIPRHNFWYVQPIFNHTTALKSCLKINDKSKGGKYLHIFLFVIKSSKTRILNRCYDWFFHHAVQKVKSKTPAQDRLQKVVKVDPNAVTELLKSTTIDLKPIVKNVLPKNYLSAHGQSVGFVNSLKPSDIVKFVNDVKPRQAVGNVERAKPAEPANKIKWSNDFIRNDSIGKIVSTTKFDAATKPALASSSSSFHLPGNGSQTCQSKLQSDIIKKGHDFQVQNRLKINDNSKIIGGKWLFIFIRFN